MRALLRLNSVSQSWTDFCPHLQSATAGPIPKRRDDCQSYGGSPSFALARSDSQAWLSISTRLIHTVAMFRLALRAAPRAIVRPAVAARAPVAFRAYSAAALTKEDVTSRVLDVLKSFEKVDGAKVRWKRRGCRAALYRTARGVSGRSRSCARLPTSCSPLVVHRRHRTFLPWFFGQLTPALSHFLFHL